MPTVAVPFSRASFVRAAIVLVPLLLLLGGLSARVSGSTEDNGWYQTLTLPALQPPGPVFGIAWSILYTGIGLAAAIAWATRPAGAARRWRSVGLLLFVAGFAVNLTWSPAFFRMHLIGAALGIIVVMLCLALATTIAFGRFARAAAWLMVPYLVWLCFAAGLNARILMLNPTADAAAQGV